MKVIPFPEGGWACVEVARARRIRKVKNACAWLVAIAAAFFVVWLILR